MDATDDPRHNGRRVEAVQHALSTPLTVILARTQLLARRVRRSPTLDADERDKLLAGLATIELAAQDLVRTIDGLH
jgi:signal transduction histidine kinase